MCSIVRNTDVEQRTSQAVVVAVSSQAVFDSETEHDPGLPDLLKKGPAFSFIEAVQQVNEKLLDKNPAETLLFDVILLSNDSKDTNSKIIASVKHYGLPIGRFCFCNKDDNITSLQSSDAKLFLSTDRNDVFTASQQGVPSALLFPQQASEEQDWEELKVVFSGDSLGFSQDDLSSLREQGFTEPQLQSLKAAKGSVKEFAVQMGEMRSRFGLVSSPLRAGLVTLWGSRDVCARALRTLRGWGLHVDEAFCLAGAPPRPILRLMQPHVLCVDGLLQPPGGATLGGGRGESVME